MLLLTTLPTRQDGVENRDKTHYSVFCLCFLPKTASRSLSNQSNYTGKKNTGKLEKLFEQSSTQYFNIAINKLCKIQF